MGKRPVLTLHALHQMKRRGITHEEVYDVLDGGSTSVPSTRDPRARKLWKSVGGRRITLIVGPSAQGGESVWTVYDRDAED
jgi:hypothetical protein